MGCGQHVDVVFLPREILVNPREICHVFAWIAKRSVAILITSIKFDRGELKISHHPDELSQLLQGKQAIMFEGKNIFYDI